MTARTRRNPAILRAAAGGTPQLTPVLPAPPALHPPPKVFGCFDRCYLLNLDRDAVRLGRMSRRLGRLAVPFERFPALEARGDEPAFPGRPELTPAHFACARSHLALLRLAMERGHERVLVLEDDVVLRDDAADRVRRLGPQLDAMRWDVLYLGLHLVEGGGRAGEGLGRVARGFHRHAYAVARAALPVLIRVIESGIRDGYHDDCYEHPGLVKLYADPILAIQEPGESRVLGGGVDRLGQYFPPFDREEFMAHCEEARSWGAGGAPAPGGPTAAEAEEAHWEGQGGPSPRPSSGGAGGLGEGEGAAAGAGKPAEPPLAASQIGRRPSSGTGAGAQGGGSGAIACEAAGGEAAAGASDLAAAVREAKRRHRGGKLAEAEKLYRQVLEREPGEPEALHYLGLLEQQRGRSAEALELIRRSVALRPGAGEYHANLGMVLNRLDRHEEAVEALGRAAALGADGAEVQCNRASSLDRLGRGEEVLAAWRRAVELRPAHAEAHHRLGHKLAQSAKGAGPGAGAEDLAEGIRHLREAVRLAPRNAEALNQLGVALRKAGELEAAAEQFRAAAAARPAMAEAHANLGAALNELGRPDEAVSHLEKAIDLRGDFVDAHWNLALALLGRGDLGRGWLEHEWRRRLAADAYLRREFPQPEWNGCDVSGRTLLVVCEQGLGDTLQFVRYVPLLERRGAKVVLECQAPLRELLASLDGGERPGGAARQVVARGEPLPRFDAHVRLMSVPGIVGTRLGNVPADVPYLHPQERRVRDWGRRLEEIEGGSPDCLRVGIAWQGNPAFPGDRDRSVPLAEFAPLAAVPGVRLYSLQKNQGAEQLKQLNSASPPPQAGPFGPGSPPPQAFDVAELPGLDEGCGAFLDTAAVMAHLDLVITSDTSMAHLAGALGVRVWLAAGYGCDWRWLRDRDDSPWYPTMRLFRQPRRGDWPSVFRTMARALRDTLRAAPPRPAEQAPLVAPLSPGDLLDRLGILQIKCERLSDPAKLRAVRLEREALLAARQRWLPASEQLEILSAELKRVNEQLWGVEDEIRLCERSGDFGPRFVELARSVYRTNDRRADLKRQINAMLDSPIREEKEYQAYD